MTVSIDDIKTLRDKTGMSIAQCKEALEESKGDFDGALKALDSKSALIAQKKGDRTLGAGVVQAYIHTNKAQGAMVLLSCETDFVAGNEEFVALAYDIALHACAMKPLYVNRDAVDSAVLDEVRTKFEEEVPQDKPDDVKKKILDGKVDAYFKEVVLLEQQFVKDDSKTINDLVLGATQKFGERVELSEMSIFQA